MAINRSQLIGKIVGSHHQVIDVLGEGTYSVVMSCCNLSTKKIEAIKLFKQRHNIADVAQKEVSILEGLRRLDPDKSNIIRWNSSFSSEQLSWISFELLDQDLRTYVKCRSVITGTRALLVSVVRPILHQLSTALSHLKTVGIVHADLKPDNILCVNRNQLPVRVKLADFGLAQYVDKIDSTWPVQTLCYRAPEVLVGSVYNEAIDMWSLGVTAAELVLGTFLYGVSNEYDALRAIIETQGQLPDYLMDQGKFSHYYFQKGPNSLSRWRIKTPKVFHQQTGQLPRKDLQVFRSLDNILDIMEEIYGAQQGQYLLIDLITKMLMLDPKERIDPLEALKHKFFSETIPPSRDVQQKDIHGQTSDMKYECQRDVQLESGGCFQQFFTQTIQAGNHGHVQPDIAGYHQIWNCVNVQEAVPAYGQYGPWIPVYFPTINQYLLVPQYAPIGHASVHPAYIHAYYTNVPGYFNIHNCGYYQPNKSNKCFEEKTEKVNLKKKAMMLYGSIPGTRTRHRRNEPRNVNRGKKIQRFTKNKRFNSDSNVPQ